MNKIFNILVLCPNNSARSILGEALFNHHGAGRVRAWSAGSHAGGGVNPLALETLQRHGIDKSRARSKSWKELVTNAIPRSPLQGVPRHTNFPVAPAPDHFDFIVTVCGSAADVRGPVWPGNPTAVHWGIPDPTQVEPPEARREAFEETFRSLEKRVLAFLSLPLETLTPEKSALAARRIHTGA
ncbi:MAG: arsenate reductase ArsC [Sulfuritalea sp.]|nr:arsenate reductase ArsC [Sulfuritalea sp.]